MPPTISVTAFGLTPCADPFGAQIWAADLGTRFGTQIGAQISVTAFGDTHTQIWGHAHADLGTRTHNQLHPILHTACCSKPHQSYTQTCHLATHKRFSLQRSELYNHALAVSGGGAPSYTTMFAMPPAEAVRATQRRSGFLDVEINNNQHPPPTTTTAHHPSP